MPKIEFNKGFIYGGFLGSLSYNFTRNIEKYKMIRSFVEPEL